MREDAADDRSDSVLPEIRRERLGGGEGLPGRVHRCRRRAGDREVHRGTRRRRCLYRQHDLLGHGVAPPRPRLRVVGPSVSAISKTVLVTGATGKQGGHLVRELLARGHSVRALTRKPESPAAAALKERGVTIVPGDFDDQGSLERAARGVDTVFAMSTPFESGDKTETREGNQHRSRGGGRGGLASRLFVGGRRRPSDRHSAFRQQVRGRERDTTVGRAVHDRRAGLLHGELLADCMAAGIAKGSIAMALPATRRLQQIAVADIAQFTALVIERRESFLGKRIDIASDELTGATAAAAISEVSGGTSSTRRFRSTQYVRRMKMSRACSSGSTAWDTTRTSSAFDRSIPKSTGTASASGLASSAGLGLGRDTDRRR